MKRITAHKKGVYRGHKTLLSSLQDEILIPIPSRLPRMGGVWRIKILNL